MERKYKTKANLNTKANCESLIPKMEAYPLKGLFRLAKDRILLEGNIEFHVLKNQ